MAHKRFANGLLTGEPGASATGATQPPPVADAPGSPVVWLLLGFWAIAVGLGMVGLMHYETAPGSAAIAAGRWPTPTRLPLDAGRPTLVLFVHPHCPCSRASVEELAYLLARCQERVAAHVLFLNPAEQPEDWVRTDLWDSAAAIPGVQLSVDRDGALAKEFGVVTSGHVLVFAPDGGRLFSGGITGSRGHVGENAGRNAILALIYRKEPEATELPVFGCPMFEPSACSRRVHSCPE